jgi:hypothetical protein
MGWALGLSKANQKILVVSSRNACLLTGAKI